MVKKTLCILAVLLSVFLLTCSSRRCEENCRDQCAAAGGYYISSDASGPGCHCECGYY